MFACAYALGEGTARLLADRASGRRDVTWILRPSSHFPRLESEQSQVVERADQTVFSAVYLFLLQGFVGLVAQIELRGVPNGGELVSQLYEPGSRRVYGQHFSRRGRTSNCKITEGNATVRGVSGCYCP